MSKLTLNVINDIEKGRIEIPTISPAAIELINVIDRAQTSRREIYRLVALDAVLCIDIFKYVNSAVFTSTKKPRNVQEAIDIMGLKELKNIIYYIAAKDMCSDVDLWHAITFTAVTAQKLARQLKKSEQECSDVFLAGLFYALGQLVFKHCYSKDYHQVAQEADPLKRLRLEEQIFGLNHIALSYEILHQYGLPSSVLEIVRNQQNLDFGEFAWQNELIRLAKLLNDFEYDDFSKFELALKANNKLEEFGLLDLKLDCDRVLKLYKEVREFMKL